MNCKGVCVLAENLNPVGNLIIENRNRLSVSGVSETESFDESCVVLFTSCGRLIIRGEGLHIQNLSVSSGEASVVGRIDSVNYTENTKKKKEKLSSRLFK